MAQLITEPWEVRRFHLWYMHAAKAGMKEFIVRVPKEFFHLEEDCFVPIEFRDMHSLLRRQDLDVAQVTIFAL